MGADELVARLFIGRYFFCNSVGVTFHHYCQGPGSEMNWFRNEVGSQEQMGESPAYLLELRIHGIRNTPPAEMLCVSPESVKRTRGDAFGNFWTVKDSVISENVSTTSPESIPPGVHREAYSWGTLNRFNPAGPGRVFGRLGQVLSQIAWTLLLPFGLCNVAYWARNLPVPEVSPIPGQRLPKVGWMHGNGAASIRLFALVLTLLYIAAFASVSFDLVGTQCFRSGRQVCSQLPGFLDVLSGWGRGQRLAVLSVVPLVAIFLLYFVSRRSRVAYEENVYSKDLRGVQDDPDEGSLGAPAAPVLATKGFWRHALLSSITERLHLAASLTFLAGILAWDGLFAGNEACHSLSLQTLECFAPPSIPGPRFSYALIGAAIVLLAFIAWRTVVGSEACPDVAAKQFGDGKQRRIQAGVLLTLSVLLFSVSAIRTASLNPAGESTTAFQALQTIPTTLVAVLLVLSLSALGWRRGLKSRYTMPLLTVMAVSLLLLNVGEGANPAFLFAGFSGFLFLTLLILVRRGETRYQAWRGCGPGVLLLLSAGVAMILSSLLVVGTAVYLKQPLYEGTEEGMWRTAVDRGEAEAQSNNIMIPATYLEFGIISTCVALGIVVVVAAVTGLHLTLAPRLLTTPLPEPPKSKPELAEYGSGKPAKAQRPVKNAAEKLVIYQRRQAALAHRGEPVLAILSVLLAAGMAFTLSASTARSMGAPNYWNLPLPFGAHAETLAIFILGSVAAAALGAILVGSLAPAERPAALLWDLICFLPRAGHPFGPPCYADRVVPEIRDRVQEWLSREDLIDQVQDEGLMQERRVVLSAHSLGAVLAMAVIFSLDDQWQKPSKVGVITYGTQLRSYFGRIFPELLGPSALGNRYCRAPSLVSADPWIRQIKEDFTSRYWTNNDPARAPETAVQTLVKILTPSRTPLDTAPEPNWINLWRRTDFLGFPVYSYAENRIDRGADELQEHSYMLEAATHGGYPYSKAYRTRLEELMKRMQRGD